MVQRLAVVQHHAAEGPGRLREWTQRHGFALDVFRADLERLPPPDRDGPCVLLGGPYSVNAPPGWLRREKVWLQERVAQGSPTLGICLGSQLLAEAMGGRVRALPQSETGWKSISFEDGSPPMDALQWHEEGIALPPGAVLLASSELCEVQVFVGGSRIGVQFHPEWDAGLVAELNAHFGADSPLPHTPDAERHAHVSAWLERMMQTWLALW